MPTKDTEKPVTYITVELLDELFGSGINTLRRERVASGSAIDKMESLLGWKFDRQTFADMYGWEIKPNSHGRLSKRIRKYAKEAGQTVTDDLISVACEVATSTALSGGEVYFAIIDRMEWNRGDFGDAGSCFWASEDSARARLTYGNGRVIVTFTRKNWGAKNGRCLIAPVDMGGHPAISLFNGYGGTSSAKSGKTGARGFAALLEAALHAKGIVCKMSQKPYSFGIYTNSDSGYTIYHPSQRGDLYGKFPRSVDYTAVTHRMSGTGRRERLDGKAFALHADHDRIPHAYLIYKDGTKEVVRTDSTRIKGYTRCKNPECPSGAKTELGWPTLLTKEDAASRGGYCETCFNERYVVPAVGNTDPRGYMLKSRTTPVHVSMEHGSRWERRESHVPTQYTEYLVTCPGCGVQHLPVRNAGEVFRPHEPVACPDCSYVAAHVPLAITNTLGEEFPGLDEWLRSRILPTEPEQEE